MSRKSYFRIALVSLAWAGMAGISVMAHGQAASTPAAPSAAAVPAAGVPVKAEHQDAFYVMGMSVHAKASEESGGDGQIPGLWQSFIQQGTASNIPNKVGDDLYVVYTNMDAAGGTYDYLLGARVTSIDHVPAGMVAKLVPAGKYAIVPSEVGPAQDVIPAVWQKIWTMTPEQLGGKRAMKADFEIYNLQGFDPQNAQVDVHVGLQ